MPHLATQSILELYEIKDNQLLIGGRTCSDIAAQIGTPFYAYDLGIAKKKLETLRSAIPERVHVHYAIKANPHPDVLRLFLQQGTGFDVASAGELQMLLDVGADAGHIGFAGPGKREFELRLACRTGIGSLNVESIGELELADRIAAEEGRRLRVALRVNPAYELVGSGMKMGGGPKQFGIDQEEVLDVLGILKHLDNLEFVGFHIFAGSQNLRVESLISAFEGALDTVIEVMSACPQPPRMVNLGGGFGIPYYAADKELDIVAVGEGLQAAIDRRRADLADIRLVVETGRYLIAESGLYVSRILYRKQSRGETFLVLDGGMHQHLAASGNFGQVLKKNYPIVVPERLRSDEVETVNLVGPLCTPLDRLGNKVELPRTERGDLVAVMASGAYGFSASPLAFLGHSEPAEIAV